MLAMIAPRERGVAGAGAEAKGSQVDLQPTVRRWRGSKDPPHTHRASSQGQLGAPRKILHQLAIYIFLNCIKFHVFQRLWTKFFMHFFHNQNIIYVVFRYIHEIPNYFFKINNSFLNNVYLQLPLLCLSLQLLISLYFPYLSLCFAHRNSSTPAAVNPWPGCSNPRTGISISSLIEAEWLLTLQRATTDRKEGTSAASSCILASRPASLLGQTDFFQTPVRRSRGNNGRIRNLEHLEKISEDWLYLCLL